MIFVPPTLAPVSSTAWPPLNDQVNVPALAWSLSPPFHVGPSDITAVAAAELPLPPLIVTVGADV